MVFLFMVRAYIVGALKAMRFEGQGGRNGQYVQVGDEHTVEGSVFRGLADEEEMAFDDESFGGRLDKHARGLRRSWNLVWTTFVITAYIVLAWKAYTLIEWSETTDLHSSALQDMPIYGASLQYDCAAAPHLCHNTTTSATFHVPIGTSHADHLFDLRGGAVGTLTIAHASSDSSSSSSDIEVELTLRSDNATLVDHVVVYAPQADADGRVPNSHFVLLTPNRAYLGTSYMRFDAVLRVPARLRHLHVLAHTVTQVRFAPGIIGEELESVDVTLLAEDDRGMVVLHEGVRARRIGVEAHGGWVVGELAIAERASVETRGDAVMTLRVRPRAADAGLSFGSAELRTVSGSGAAEIVYVRAAGGESARRIESWHYSAERGRVWLDYRGARVEGRVSVDARAVDADRVNGDIVGGTGTDLLVGDWGGQDQVVVKAPAGWVGMYF
ncbi:hypothetical protein EW146_g3452 [Bondarzewia mesenterica]|uniref:Adhesin domain-containing protein n=1 Tax=Bondarzewia mesenterica TaxID=1095465 RepID=A0A4V3XFF3_9AGAM|nr:hypothetical protein EW146_g3452 [Bondarzewia mesenterica]